MPTDCETWSAAFAPPRPYTGFGEAASICCCQAGQVWRGNCWVPQFKQGKLWKKSINSFHHFIIWQYKNHRFHVGPFWWVVQVRFGCTASRLIKFPGVLQIEVPIPPDAIHHWKKPSHFWKQRLGVHYSIHLPFQAIKLVSGTTLVWRMLWVLKSRISESVFQLIKISMGSQMILIEFWVTEWLQTITNDVDWLGATPNRSIICQRWLSWVVIICLHKSQYVHVAA